MELTRRQLLRSVCAGTAAPVGAALSQVSAEAAAGVNAFVDRTFGRGATLSGSGMISWSSRAAVAKGA
jgi:hypothetical protein